jgi:hypothetical protein
MAFLTLYSPYHLNSYTVNLFIPDVFVEFFINAVEFIIGELHLGIAMTIDAPAHAQVGKLVHLIHFGDITMARLALLLSNHHVLGVIKVNMIRQVMNALPFDRLTVPGILLLIGIPAGI